MKLFFKFYSMWEWPNPVVIEKKEDKENRDWNIEENWNPLTSIKDSSEFMPIISPSIDGKATNTG
jgi:poly(A) polymerase Pap1